MLRSPERIGRPAERGYAMIAAVVSVALFATLALGAIKSGRSAVVGATAEQVRARLSSAATAGLMLAVHNLAADDPAQRWAADGAARAIDFDGVHLTIAVEDESGKIPLNFVQLNVIRRLFELGGAAPAEIDPMVAAFRILRGDPGVANAPTSAVRAGGGPFTAVDELKLLPGMTPALYARIAPAVTVAGTTLAFDPGHAGSFALSVMRPGSNNAVAAITASRERAGQTVALSATPLPELGARMVSVRVDASKEPDGFFERVTIVEFTGFRTRPFVLRGAD